MSLKVLEPRGAASPSLADSRHRGPRSSDRSTMRRRSCPEIQMTKHVWTIALIAAMSAAAANADEKLAGVACRSVHLQYPAPDGDAFYNEVTVAKSSEGTYFCVCGFSKGYYGIQELGNGKKLL